MNITLMTVSDKPVISSTECENLFNKFKIEFSIFCQ